MIAYEIDEAAIALLKKKNRKVLTLDVHRSGGG